MQTYADGPSPAVGYKLRRARFEAQLRATRRFCDACGQRRLCADVDGRHHAYCLAECWPYFLGVQHGHDIAGRRLGRMLELELDRVFHPAALEANGWPWYRCDGCGQDAPHPISAESLWERGWRRLGHDAHLCGACGDRLEPRRENGGGCGEEASPADSTLDLSGAR